MIRWSVLVAAAAALMTSSVPAVAQTNGVGQSMTPEAMIARVEGAQAELGRDREEVVE